MILMVVLPRQSTHLADRITSCPCWERDFHSGLKEDDEVTGRETDSHGGDAWSFFSFSSLSVEIFDHAAFRQTFDSEIFSCLVFFLL